MNRKFLQPVIMNRKFLQPVITKSQPVITKSQPVITKPQPGITNLKTKYIFFICFENLSLGIPRTQTYIPLSLMCVGHE